jgi:formylglycine-generating enzyme required for sulfatase activity
MLKKQLRVIDDTGKAIAGATAAYYNPGTSSYYRYPTSSNTAPAATGPTGTPNSANYNFAQPNLTDVGAYSGTTSPYGAFDMGGNITQWNEALISGSSRGLRGGNFTSGSGGLLSSFRGVSNPADLNLAVGFRLASVPEPSTIVLAVLGMFALLACKKWHVMHAS